MTVQDRGGAPVPYADIVTVIEGFDFYGHSTADAQGHASKSLLAGRHITICADYHYLHSACGPGFVLSPGETRSVTIVLDLAGEAPGTSGTPGSPSASPTPQASPNAPSGPPPQASSPAVALSGGPSAGPRPAACRFVLGFQALHDQIASVVGDCVDDERHNPQNSDGLQHTARGLLVWRKADNSTAFTDGYHTWVNGPYGVRERLNTQRFAWEANPDGLPVVR